MKRVVFLMALIILMSPFRATAEDIIKKGESLNLERCIEIALRRHPSIVAAQNTVHANQSKVGQAGANYYPQIDLSAGYSRVNSASSRSLSTGSTGSSSSYGSSSGSSGDSYDQYSGSVTLKQNIYDFGKTHTQVNIQNLNLDSSISDLDNTTGQVTFNVSQAYYGVLKAKRNRDVAEETVRQFQQHLEQAKGFFEVGTKPKFDVTKAEVDLSNARLNLIRAANALRTAMVTFNNALGVPDAPEYVIEDNLSFRKYEMPLEDAIEKAYANRHDLKSIVAKKRSSGEAIELAKKGYYPSLSGSASYSRSGESFPLKEGWNAGVTLSFPVFSGFLTKNQVEESKANLNVIKANEESLRQNILLDVQQAYLNLTEAEERIGAAELTVRQATENFEIANGRYGAGVGNPIEVTDAEVALANAKTAHIQALYDYKVAHASMERAMGTR